MNTPAPFGLDSLSSTTVLLSTLGDTSGSWLPKGLASAAVVAALLGVVGFIRAKRAGEKKAAWTQLLVAVVVGTAFVASAAVISTHNAETQKLQNDSSSGPSIADQLDEAAGEHVEIVTYEGLSGQDRDEEHALSLARAVKTQIIETVAVHGATVMMAEEENDDPHVIEYTVATQGSGAKTLRCTTTWQEDGDATVEKQLDGLPNIDRQPLTLDTHCA